MSGKLVRLNSSSSSSGRSSNMSNNNIASSCSNRIANAEQQQQQQQPFCHYDNANLKEQFNSNNNLKRSNVTTQKEDSGTESGDDLRLLAAGLRDKLQMQSDTNLIEEVTAALSRLENSLKEGNEIPLDGNRRRALLALVARLQTGLTGSPAERLAEFTATATGSAAESFNDPNCDDDDATTPELNHSSPERAGQRQRFNKRRTRNGRYTIGVSHEELADARRYMMAGEQPEEQVEEVQVQPTPVEPYQRARNEPSVHNGYHLQPTNAPTYNLNHNGNRRPLSGDYSSVSHPAPTEQRETRQAATRLQPHKRQLMKRANTIDIAKARLYNPEFDTDSDLEQPLQPGLKRAVQVNVKQQVRNAVPPFEPKTENDRKFLAFINKQTYQPSVGWHGSARNARSVSNWTNKFGNLKHTFEVGAAATVTTGKPPQVPGHVHGPPAVSAKANWNRQSLQDACSQPQQQLPSYQKRREPPSNHNGASTDTGFDYRSQQQHKSSSDQLYSSTASQQSYPAPVLINKFIHAPQSVFRPIQPESSFKPSKSATNSPVGLPWLSKPVVDTNGFKQKAQRFDQQHELTRHNSLRSQRDNYDELRKRPSLPNTMQPLQEPYGQLPALPPPTNISFTYSKPSSNYRSYPCLPSADSLTNPHGEPLVLTSSNPSYCPHRQFEYASPLLDSAPSTTTANNTDDDELESDSSMLEYRAETKVMCRPKSQRAITVADRRNPHASDDEVFGRNSRAARSLLNTMRNIGRPANNGTAAANPICLSPEGREYQAPIVEPLFPQLTEFVPNRMPNFEAQSMPKPESRIPLEASPPSAYNQMNWTNNPAHNYKPQQLEQLPSKPLVAPRPQVVTEHFRPPMQTNNGIHESKRSSSLESTHRLPMQTVVAPVPAPVPAPANKYHSWQQYADNEMQQKLAAIRRKSQERIAAYKSSAPADTPDIVKSSLPKDENAPILKKFGPAQRHHYVPNAYQSPLVDSKSATTTATVSNTSIISSSSSRLLVAGGRAYTKPIIVETPATPPTQTEAQPEELIPRNIVFNNVHAFSSLSRRAAEEQGLSKCDSWNHIAGVGGKYQSMSAVQSNELRRSKSGHTLAVPKMFEAGIDKAQITQKQRTVAAYFKTPPTAEHFGATKRTAINRMRTSEKISTSHKSHSSLTAVGLGAPMMPARTAAGGGGGGVGLLMRSATMPHIAHVKLLDETNVEDAFEQLMSGA